jgi:altronate dehydratase
MKPVLVISERDNVATALEALEPGRDLTFARGRVSVVEAVPSGHKIALCAIHAGEAVIKYGSPIGLATAEIAAGAHVHTHNLASTRGRGDLEAPPRLAEPDERDGGGRS